MYHSLLCLLGNGPDADQVLARACAARDTFGAQLFLLQVVEFLPVSGAEDAMLATPLILADEMESQAREAMQKHARKAGVDLAKTEVVQGDFLQETTRFAKTHDIDLIITGKHERHGFSAWFNHAEDDVLHSSPCDLLAVHLAS